MVNKVMQWIVIILSLTVLIAIAISLKLAKPPNLPSPMIDRLTGYPTWQPIIKPKDQNRVDAANLSSIVLMLVAGIVGLRAVRNPPKKSKLLTHIFAVPDDSDGHSTGTPAYGFDLLILLYNWITFITLITSMLINVGKMWSTVGVLHNTAEIAVLVLLGNNGRIASSSFLGWILFYIVSVVAFCVFADFPGDALFFKFQGLCIDFALVIEFTRVYIATKEHIRDAGREALPLNEDDINDDHDDNDNNDNSAYSYGRYIRASTINHPNQLLLLILAATLHVGGNVLATFYPAKLIPMVVFLFTYTTAYPIYVYYVYLDINGSSILPQKRIYVPSTPSWKVAVIAITSISLSLLTMRLSLFFI